MLTNEQMQDVLAQLGAGKSKTELAKQYNMSRSTFRRVLAQHLEVAEPPVKVKKPRKPRSNSEQMLPRLLDQRQKVQVKYEKKMAELTAKIDKLESKQNRLAKLQELLAGTTPEQLDQQLQLQQNLLKSALKASND